MGNFIKADVYRIMTKRSRIVLMLLFVLVRMIRLFSKMASPEINIYEATDQIGGFDVIYVMIMMLVNLFIIYGDDIKARSMQVAIGLGMKRTQIVIAKWISMVIVVSSDLLFLTILEFAGVGISGKLASGYMVTTVLLGRLDTLLEIIMSVTLSMGVTFFTQKIVLGVFVYLIVILCGLNSIVRCFASVEIVRRLRLWQISAVTQLEIFQSKLYLGLFDWKSFVIILIYLALGFGVTMRLFKKKELDF